MKKKIASLALAAMIVLSLISLTSCEKLTAYGLISKGIEKSESLDSMEADMTLQIKMELQGTSVNVPIVYHVKAAGLKTENPVMSAGMQISMLGQEMKTDIYSEGEYFYLTVNNEQSMKFKADESTQKEYDVVDKMKDTLQLPSEEVFKDVKIQENEGGSKTVSTELSDEIISENYQDLIDSMSSLASAGGEIGNVAFSGAKLSATVNKDGYISAYELSFDMKMDAKVMEETTEVKASAVLKLEYNNPGADVTVTPPEGYKDFPETDMSRLAG